MIKDAVMYSIDQFRQLNKEENILLTQHSRIRLAERRITIADIMGAIESGQIIEDYQDDFPFPSCLIFGNSKGRVLHVCASIDEGYIYLITAYEPDLERWQEDYKTRRVIEE